MVMDSCGSCGGFSSALPTTNLTVQWKGFQSREVWERSHNAGAWSSRSSGRSGYSSSFSVASTGNLRAAARNMAKRASLSTSSQFSSSFLGRRSGEGLRRSHTESKYQHSRSMPLVEARLFGPSIFNASKLRVLLMGKDDEKHPLQHPRIYTLTHSDVTAKITLAVAREINKAQIMGWYSKLQRDEVVAEWRRTQGEISLHVHCHISGSNFLHKFIASLRFYIFQTELPLVLKAFMHGDRNLFNKHPELQNAPVWVYFHSDVDEYNRLEFWGPLIEASKRESHNQKPNNVDEACKMLKEIELQFPFAVCEVPCDCCSHHATVIPIPASLNLFMLQCSQGSTPQKEPKD